MTAPPTTLGLIVAAGPGSTGLADARMLLDDGIVDSVWVRDLPVVPAGDPDAGQGSDPWWCLGQLCGTGSPPGELGTASVILGIRHPLVVARAAAGAQVDTGGRFVLGVGSGGKPEMNHALGIAGRSYDEFAQQWAQLRAVLRDEVPTPSAAGALPLRLPSAYRAPPVYLATSDVRRWQAVQGDADGWQTFLTGDRAGFERDHAAVCAVRGAATPTDLRLDVELVPGRDAHDAPVFTHPARGKSRCSAAQLPALLRPWRGAPVGRVLLRVQGDGALDAIRRLRDDWS